MLSIWPWVGVPATSGKPVLTGGGVPEPRVAYNASATVEEVPPPNDAGGSPLAEYDAAR